jgi:hypothetical protein
MKNYFLCNKSAELNKSLCTHKDAFCTISMGLIQIRNRFFLPLKIPNFFRAVRNLRSFHFLSGLAFAGSGETSGGFL